jgi:hypothetical protein
MPERTTRVRSYLLFSMTRPYRVISAGLALFMGCMPPASEASQPGDQSQPSPAAPALGMVLGKKLTLDDLRPPVETMESGAKREGLEGPEAWLRKHRSELLNRAIVRALADRLVKENRLEATEAEIEEFERHMGKSTAMTGALKRLAEDTRKKLNEPGLAEAERESLTKELERLETSIKEEEARQAGTDWPRENDRKEMRARSAELREKLKDPDLAPADRKELEEELAQNSRFQDLTDEQAAKEWAKFKKETTRQIAEPFIQNWKINRHLYKKYGGRILFQQAGIEPIDAMRKWLEEREKAGDFAIYDAELKEGFWEYYRKDHGAFIMENPTGHEFDKPWWAQEPAK